MMQSPMCIAPRISLRRLTFEDARSFALLLGGDRKSISMMSRMPHPCTPKSAKGWIADHAAPDSCAFGIVRKSDKDFLGVIALNTGESVPELGYWVGRPYWRCGYATEAVRTMESIARDLGFQRLAAETLTCNRASQRVLLKAGFRHKGAFERAFASSQNDNTVFRYEKELQVCN